MGIKCEGTKVCGKQAGEDGMDETGGPQGTSMADYDVFSLEDAEFLRILVDHENASMKVVSVGRSGQILN